MDGDKVVACANMSALLAHERKLRAAATANLLSLEKMLHRTRREAEDATQPTSISLQGLRTQHEREIAKEKRTSQNLKVSLVPAAPSASLIVRCSAQARLDETERELKEAVARLNNQFGSSGSARARLLHLRAEVGLLREQWAAVKSQLRTEATSTAAWLEHSMAEAIEVLGRARKRDRSLVEELTLARCQNSQLQARSRSFNPLPAPFHSNRVRSKRAPPAPREQRKQAIATHLERAKSQGCNLSYSTSGRGRRCGSFSLLVVRSLSELELSFLAGGEANARDAKRPTRLSSGGVGAGGAEGVQP